MRRTLGPFLALLMLAQLVAVAIVVPAPALGDEGEIIIAADQHVTWKDGGQNITGKVTVQGRLTVRDYWLRYNITRDAEASFQVSPGGLLEFDNVTLLHDNLSAYFFIKVEGRFVSHDSEMDHLSGGFINGGGIKVVGGELELWNTSIHNCQVQAVYAEGAGASVLLDGCQIQSVQYGVHAKDGAEVTVRNQTIIEGVTHAGVLVNMAEAEVTNTTIQAMRTQPTQGIAVRGSQLTVADCEISECDADGIELTDDASGGVYNTLIHDCTVGIRMTDSSALIKDCNIRECLDGLNLLQADPEVRQTHLTDNFNGVSSKDCILGYELVDCTIGNNSQYGVYAIGKGFSESGTRWTDAQDRPNAIARVIQWWTLDVNVTDQEGIPAAGAKVEVRSSNDTKAFNGTTNSLGTVQDITLEGHRVLNDGTTQTAGKYLVQIERGDKSVEKAITMDKSKVLTVSLGESTDLVESSLLWVVLSLVVIVALGGFVYWWFRIR